MNTLTNNHTNYTIWTGAEDDSPESIFAKWVINEYGETALHEWVMNLLSATIDLEDMAGTYRSHS
jgi:hypothetical protein